MQTRESIHQLRTWVGQGIIGQREVIDHLLIAILANGNVLMEGLPGLAKTRAIKTLSKHIESEFSRIQFTPDLLPSDITGSEVYYSEGGKGEFKFQPGPIFGNLVLADEINRAPAKVQAALLEAMEERQITVAGPPTSCRIPSWCWPPRTRSSRRGPTRCPRRRWTVSCSTWWSTIPTTTRKSRFSNWCAARRPARPVRPAGSPSR
jgi:MoxR-like ATPase